MTVRILALLTILIAPSVNAGDFTGSWSIVYPKSGIKQHDDYFELYLIQQGNKICGLHFGSAKGAAKIDSRFGSEPSPTVSGIVNENTAQVVIQSSQTVAPIEGTIMHLGTTLKWQVNNSEKHRTITIPKSAELISIPPVNLGNIDLNKLCNE